MLIITTQDNSEISKVLTFVLIVEFLANILKKENYERKLTGEADLLFNYHKIILSCVIFIGNRDVHHRHSRMITDTSRKIQYHDHNDARTFLSAKIRHYYLTLLLAIERYNSSLQIF